MSEVRRPESLDALVRWGASRLTKSPTASLDARVLAKSCFGIDDVVLIAERNRPVDAASADRYAAMIERRILEEPIAHIIGRREFWSLEIEAPPGILVPRTDSETLIEAVTRRRDRSAGFEILDLGSGSGALLCALLSEFHAARGLAIDAEPQAVATTRRNLERLGFATRARVARGNWFDGIDVRFDIIVSNPPYIRTIDRDFCRPKCATLKTRSRCLPAKTGCMRFAPSLTPHLNASRHQD